MRVVGDCVDGRRCRRCGAKNGSGGRPGSCYGLDARETGSDCRTRRVGVVGDSVTGGYKRSRRTSGQAEKWKGSQEASGEHFYFHLLDGRKDKKENVEDRAGTREILSAMHC